MRFYPKISRFTVGTVGMPGERTFYLQIRHERELLSLSIEKSQVAALSERLRYMLKEIRLSHSNALKPMSIKDTLPLDSPVEDEFRIGSIAIFYIEESGEIQIDLRALELTDSPEILLDEESASEVALRFHISTTQALTFCERADLVIAAGRQPCPFCGLPIDPHGHLCARANGYRR